MSSPPSFERSARALVASRRAAGTRTLYARDLERWLAHCGEHGADPADPAPEAATSFRDALAAEYAPLTVRRMLAAISKMYRRALGDGTAASNPFDSEVLIRPSQEDYEATELLSDEEVARIFAAIEAEEGDLSRRDLAIARILHETGARVSTVTSFERRKIARADGRVTVRDVYGKGGKRFGLALSEAASAALEAWLAVAPASPWVFPARDTSAPMRGAAVDKRFAYYGKKAGVEHLHPHRFRASFATLALDILPLHEVQAALGHADPKTTLRYDRHKRGAGVANAVAEHRRTRGKETKE